jgi:hypothetical protein
VNLRSLDPGFDPRNLATASVSLQDARYGTVESVERLIADSLARLRAAPGVEQAAVSLGLPYERLLNLGFRWADVPEADGTISNVGYVSDGFFDTLRLPIRTGRLLGPGDRIGAPPVVVVNETFARLYSADRLAVGRRLRLSSVDREIVGVVGDAMQRSAGFFVAGMQDGPITSTPTIYLPIGQTNDGMLRTVHTWFRPVWVARSASPARAALAIRDAVAAVDSSLPLADSTTMTAVMGRSMSQQRLLLTLVAVLAVAAVLLAAVGIHGLLAQDIAEREREILIRIALGATPARMMAGIVAGGLGLAFAGVAIGIGLSMLTVRVVEAFLWRVPTQDPLTYGGVALLMIVVCGVVGGVLEV